MSELRDESWNKSWKAPEFDESGVTKWGWKVSHTDKLVLGRKVDIGAFTYINAKFGVELEDEVQVGSHCSIYSVSTIDGKTGKVTIKNNAKVGTHSVIMPGVTIGKNSVVGAFSFVKEDVPDDVLVLGIPAKVKRSLK